MNSNYYINKMSYDTTDLLDKLYLKLNARDKNTKDKIFIKPHVNRVFQWIEISNFLEICKNINRSPEDVTHFFENELGVRTTTNFEGVLTIKRRFMQKQIEKVFQNYILKMIRCKDCCSDETDLITHKKLKKIVCKYCKSSRII